MAKPLTKTLPVLLIAVLTLAAYAPAYRGYIWDDDAYVTENSLLAEAGGLGRIWLEPKASPQYYPMVFTSFWIERRLWGLRPLGFHATNVLLHLLGAILLGVALRPLEVPGAWLAAAVFAVHPVNVESVAWVTERKNVLSLVFYLLSLLAYLRFCGVGPDPPTRRRWGAWGLALGLFVLALLSKTVTCSLPAALLVLLWWKRRRFPWTEVLWLLPFFAIGLTLGLTTAWLEQAHVGARYVDLGLSGPERVLLAGRIIWFYAGKLLWPVGLVFVYPRWVVDGSAAWQYLLPAAAAGVILAGWLLRGRLGKGPLAALLIFGGTLVPALGFIDVFPMRYSYVADHFLYHASPALIALGCAGLALLVRRVAGAGDRGWTGAGGRAGLAARWVGAAALLSVLATLTWRQCGIYEGPETLWRHTLAGNPNAAMAHINLGNLLADRGERVEAIAHYRQVFEVRPPEQDTFVLARTSYNLGNSLYALRRYAEALDAYEQAIATEPRYSRPYHGRGIAFIALGRIDEAVESLEQAATRFPGDAPLRAARDDARGR